MIEPDFLSVPELAERWKQSPRQIIAHALALKLPIVFAFDGLAINKNNRWLCGGGAHDEEIELEDLRETIPDLESRIALNVRGKPDEFERMSREAIKDMRQSIIKTQDRIGILRDLLEKREHDRHDQHYRGYIRALPATLWQLSDSQETAFPFLGADPSVSVTLADVDGKIEWDCGLISLERGSAPWKPKLTHDGLMVPMKSIRAWEAAQSESESPEKHVTKEQRKFEAILSTLREMGYDPKALPAYKNGAHDSVKSAVRDRLLKRRDIFVSEGTFNDAWQKLRNFKEIKEDD